MAPSYGMDPLMGANVIWIVMLSTMLGGMASLPGAVVGGIIIGQTGQELSSRLSLSTIPDKATVTW